MESQEMMYLITGLLVIDDADSGPRCGPELEQLVRRVDFPSLGPSPHGP